MHNQFKHGKTVQQSEFALRDPVETRKLRAMRFAKRNKTEGRKADFMRETPQSQ